MGQVTFTMGGGAAGFGAVTVTVQINPGPSDNKNKAASEVLRNLNAVVRDMRVAIVAYGNIAVAPIALIERR